MFQYFLMNIEISGYCLVEMIEWIVCFSRHGAPRCLLDEWAMAQRFLWPQSLKHDLHHKHVSIIELSMEVNNLVSPKAFFCLFRSEHLTQLRTPLQRILLRIANCCHRGTVSPHQTLGIVTGVPPNKVAVGTAPPPNITQVKSRIGSMDNVKHRPQGGKVKVGVIFTP